MLSLSHSGLVPSTRTAGDRFRSTDFLLGFIALNSFDIDCGANFRINALVHDVCDAGSVWHLDSWDDTILYSAGASIIAFN